MHGEAHEGDQPENGGEAQNERDEHKMEIREMNLIMEMKREINLKMDMKHTMRKTNLKTGTKREMNLKIGMKHEILEYSCNKYCNLISHVEVSN